MKMVKKNHFQTFLEECIYKIKKKKIVEFIDVELDLNDSGYFFDSEKFCFSNNLIFF